MPIASAVSTLLDQFHARRPVRAWSLIITIYGDAIVPRGGRLWLGSLLDIMALFRIDAGHARTAMSRLTSDGWLKREKAGRNSDYRLTRQAEGRFNAATQRIYFPHAPAFDGRLRIALIGPGGNRAKARPALEKAAFAALTPTTYVAVADPSPPLPVIDGLFLVHADPADDMHALAAAAWKLDTLATAYRAFIARFTPLARALGRTSKLPAADALVARVLLIHEFRRIVLRDPGLPAALLPPDWPGTAARQLAARLSGAGPANTAVLAGQVDMYTANYASALSLISSGKVRTLAVTSKNRWPNLPDVPTLDEIGIKDAETDTFQAVFAPAGTSRPIIDRLAKELAAILACRDVREKFQNIGLPVVAEGPDAFRARIAREVPMYKDAIDKAGLKIKQARKRTGQANRVRLFSDRTLRW